MISKKPHTCSICMVEFHALSRLSNHMDSHSILCGITCYLCNRPIRYEHNLIHHWRKNCDGVQLFLSERERTELPNRTLKEIIFGHILSLEESEDHDDTVDPMDDTVEHINRWKEPSTCSYCNITMSPSTIVQHYSVHNNLKKLGTANRSSRTPYACDICGLLFRRRSYLYKHWRESCDEVLANIPSTGLRISDKDLRDFVCRIFQSGVIVQPTSTKHEEEEEVYNHEEEDLSEDEKCGEYSQDSSMSRKRYADDFSPHIVGPSNVDRNKWKHEIVQCLKCLKTFANMGRYERHLNVYHDVWKPNVECVLCGMKYKTRKLLLQHFRKTCQAMQVEIMNNEERKKMDATDLINYVNSVKQMWSEVVRTRKKNLLRDMEMFLNECRPLNEVNKKQIEMPRIPVHHVGGDRIDSIECPYCQLRFKNSSLVTQHVGLVHKYRTQVVDMNKTKQIMENNIKRARIEQKLEEDACFFGKQGNFYQKGKFINPDSNLMVAIRNFSSNGSRSVFKMKINKGRCETESCVIVRLLDKEKYVMLSEQEGTLLKELNGSLEFYESNPCVEKMPILNREE